MTDNDDVVVVVGDAPVHHTALPDVSTKIHGFFYAGWMDGRKRTVQFLVMLNNSIIPLKTSNFLKYFQLPSSSGSSANPPPCACGSLSDPLLRVVFGRWPKAAAASKNTEAAATNNECSKVEMPMVICRMHALVVRKPTTIDLFKNIKYIVPTPNDAGPTRWWTRCDGRIVDDTGSTRIG